MRISAARQIRLGLELFAAVRRRSRVAPQLTPFGFSGAPPMPLWEQAYRRAATRAVMGRGRWELGRFIAGPTQTKRTGEADG